MVQPCRNPQAAAYGCKQDVLRLRAAVFQLQAPCRSRTKRRILLFRRITDIFPYVSVYPFRIPAEFPFFLLCKIITSRNLQPLFYKAFRPYL
ncbi:hypothetical protein BEI62_20010 [Eisenbergiella tayi]|nr:hypothetical protein BEI62_20010 [Eisenbergiella tayi]